MKNKTRNRLGLMGVLICIPLTFNQRVFASSLGAMEIRGPINELPEIEVDGHYFIGKIDLEELERFKEEKAKEELEKVKAQEQEKERIQAEQELKAQEDNTPRSEIGTALAYMTFSLSFYTDLADEGGGLGLTADGSQVAYGLVANNHLPFGTEIVLEGYGTFTVADRGNPYYFSTVDRLDVFMPRQAGEDDYTYKQRVLAMGVQEVGGYVIYK